MNAVRTFARREGGATIVEFALVTPVLILVLVACLDFARAINAHVTVANASHEGARYAALHPSANLSAITASVAARVVLLDKSALVVGAYYDDDGDVTTVERPWPVAGGVPPSSPVPTRITVRVEVGYPWQSTTWLVGSFFSATGQRTFTSSSSVDAIR